MTNTKKLIENLGEVHEAMANLIGALDKIEEIESEEIDNLYEMLEVLQEKVDREIHDLESSL